MNPKLQNLIREYLQEAKLMQLATVSNGQPWVCSVWFASDARLNIYWLSGKSRRHSAEVTENPKVAGAMALPHTPDDKPRGLQFQGVVEKLTEKADIQEAIDYYAGRIFSKEKIEQLMLSPANPHDFYRIKPSLFVLFDAVNFPDNPRKQYKP